MTALLAALALAVAVFVLTVPRRPASLHARVALHLEPDGQPAQPNPRALRPWLRAAVAGAAAGTVLPVAAGAGLRLPAIPAAALIAAWLSSAHHRSRRERTAIEQTAEVPTIADALALHVLAGDPVTDAAARVAALTHGHLAEDLEQALTDPDGFPAALSTLARTTPSPHAARLYEHLAHAHRTGGRLADTLTRLGADVRAAIARDLTAEGGRRAMATYGPILGLMVPTTLLFLMYPTVVGLTSLSRT
jgi:tight adherence protein C